MKSEKLVTAGRTLDHAAGIYDAVNAILTFGHSRRMRAEAIGYMDFKPTDRILDLGCGTGVMTLQIADMLKENGHITGIDAAEKMIDVAQKNLRKMTLVDQCDFKYALAEKLPFEDASFDYCFSSMFYHHLPMDLKRQSMAETYRVLKEGGVFLTIDIDRPGNLLMKFIGVCASVLLIQPAIKENVDGVLPGLIEEAGFTQLELVQRKWDMVSMLRAVKPKEDDDA